MKSYRCMMSTTLMHMLHVHFTFMVYGTKSETKSALSLAKVDEKKIKSAEEERNRSLVEMMREYKVSFYKTNKIALNAQPR